MAISIIALPLLVLAAAGPAVLAGEGAWVPVPGFSLDAEGHAGSGFVVDGLAHAFLDPDSVRGKWVRYTAWFPPDSPHADVWLHSMTRSGRVQLGPLPSRCEVQLDRQSCTSTAYVIPEAESFRVSIYAGAGMVQVLDTKLETSDGGPADDLTTGRAEALLEKMRSLYYKSDETDWAWISEKIKPLLDAPADVDPIPHVAAVARMELPDRSHSMILAADRGPAAVEARYPSCESIGNGRWRLDLPETPDRASEADRYVEDAWACAELADARMWVINLTANQGGDAALMFAALAPFLEPGVQMAYRNAGDKEFAVALEDDGVWVGSEHAFAFTRPPHSVTVPIYFLVSRGCASSCEAVAMAANSYGTTLGQDTAGLTTANESFPLNEHYSLALPSGVMAQPGRPYERYVTPQHVLSADEMQKAIECGDIPGQ